MYRFIRLWQIGLNFRSVVLFRFSINKLSVILLSVWRLSWENENRWSDHFLIVFFASLPHLISVPWKLTFTTTSLSLAIASSSDLSHLDYNLISTLCDLYPPSIMENPILFIFLRNTVLFLYIFNLFTLSSPPFGYSMKSTVRYLLWLNIQLFTWDDFSAILILINSLLQITGNLWALWMPICLYFHSFKTWHI